MTEAFEVSAFFPGQTAEKIYNAWLDSQAHTAMTGAPAEIDPVVGGKFTAWDRYIQGKTLAAEPYRSLFFCRTKIISVKIMPDPRDGRLSRHTARKVVVSNSIAYHSLTCDFHRLT